jgi:hypothetical protein
VKIPSFYVVLGCFGRQDDGFVSCGGVENNILIIHPKMNNYISIMDYLDNGCGLFDKTMLEYNSIRHFILNMQDRYDQVIKKLWTEKQFRLYQKFTIDHRDCGLFLKLNLIEDVNEDKSDSQSIQTEVIKKDN